jgi:hypothetical protein
MKTFSAAALMIIVVALSHGDLAAQKKQILVDVSHGEKFYGDPTDKAFTELVPEERSKYMAGELGKNAAAHDASVAYLKTAVTAAALTKCNLLFIHTPSQKYTAAECAAIQHYVEKGGSLFIVIEEDYWATLDQVNANDIVKPFGISFGSNSTDALSGGHSVPGKITARKYSIPFHGARIVQGGTPFAYSNTGNTPFAVYVETKGGGKVVAMGEGMVSLYMTSWQGVNNYECAGFMGEVLGWLLK